MRIASRAAFLTAAAAAGAGVTLAGFPRPARAQAVKLRMAGIYSDSFSLPFYAKDAGSFARAGFDIDVSSIVNAGAMVAAIGGGSLELGIGDVISGVIAINAGVPIVMIAGAALYQGTAKPNPYIMATMKDSPIRGPRDFVGKVVAVPTLVGLTTTSVRAWLAQNGITIDQIKLIEFPQTTVVQAMQRGAVDVALVSEPFLTLFKNDLKDVGHPLDAIAPEFVATIWYASKSFMDADRARARRIVQAIYDTNRWANAHHDETFAILVRDGKLDGDKLHGMSRSVFATSLSPGLLQPVFDLATKAKIFDRPVDATAIIARY